MGDVVGSARICLVAVALVLAPLAVSALMALAVAAW